MINRERASHRMCSVLQSAEYRTSNDTTRRCVVLLAILVLVWGSGCASAPREPIWIGTAVLADPLQTDPRYAEVLAREFDMVTPEIAMKFEVLQPSRGEFDFRDADAIVQFAEQHQMRIRGHVLVWHEQLPAWLREGQFTREELISILHNHITTVVERYRGRVYAWDVVNEAIDPAKPNNLRDTLWLRGIGPEYIPLAFEWAHAADPDALLYYNDYGAEQPGPKFQAVQALIEELHTDGVPLHGVGLQTHVRVIDAPTQPEVETVLRHWQQLGLRADITEMDVQIQDGSGTYAEVLAQQAAVYRQVAQACRDVPMCQGFTTWGFTDRYTWIPQFTGNNDEPLLFDAEYQPKPAYSAVADTLHSFRPNR